MADTIYFVTAITEAPKVRQRLFEMIPEKDRFELAEDKWMVVYEGGTRDLAESAGVRGADNKIGLGLVLPVTTYSGRAPSALWEWLREKGA